MQSLPLWERHWSEVKEQDKVTFGFCLRIACELVLTALVVEIEESKLFKSLPSTVARDSKG